MQNKPKIGIFSASSNLACKYLYRVKNTIKIFKENNLNVNLGELAFANFKYTTGSFKQRAAEFNQLLRKNNILMSMIGGYNSSSILPYIDYEHIKLNRTKIVGYSDTTAILLAVYKKTGIQTFYGPAFLTSFYENEYIKKWNLKQLQEIVINDTWIAKELENPEYWTQEKIDWSILQIPEKTMLKNNLISFNPAIVKGRLIGGNLNTLVSIYGTEFMPEILEGDILFIEDSYKKINECERNFAFLRNTGILNKVNGVIIGKIEHFNDLGTNKNYHELFLEFLERKIPVLVNYDCAHTLPMNILKIGGQIKLDAINKKITIYSK